MVQIAPVPGHCILVTFGTNTKQKENVILLKRSKPIYSTGDIDTCTLRWFTCNLVYPNDWVNGKIHLDNGSLYSRKSMSFVNALYVLYVNFSCATSVLYQ